MNQRLAVFGRRRVHYGEVQFSGQKLLIQSVRIFFGNKYFHPRIEPVKGGHDLGHDDCSKVIGKADMDTACFQAVNITDFIFEIIINL